MTHLSIKVLDLLSINSIDTFIHLILQNNSLPLYPQKIGV